MSIDSDFLATATPGMPNVVPIDSRADLELAIALLLATGRSTLDWAERDLSRFNLTLSDCTTRLERILLADRNARVRLLIDDPTWLQSRAARLQQLHRQFPHALQMRQALAEDPVGNDAFGIVDGSHGLRLLPGDITTGELWLNDRPRSRPWLEAFERRWHEAAYDLPAFTLGL